MASPALTAKPETIASTAEPCLVQYQLTPDVATVKPGAFAVEWTFSYTEGAVEIEQVVDLNGIRVKPLATGGNLFPACRRKERTICSFRMIRPGL